MRILMLGWEFPPFISGGLGTACFGLTQALNESGHRVMFVLPKAVDRDFTSHVDLISPHRSPAGADRGGRVSDFARLPESAKLIRKPLPDGSTAEFLEYDLPGLGNVEFFGIPSSMVSSYGDGGPIDEQGVLHSADGRSLISLGQLESIRKAGKRLDGDFQVIEDAAYAELRETLESVGLGVADLGDSAPGSSAGVDYGGDVISTSRDYARLVLRLCRDLRYDVIHAHDWMTYPAGMALARLTGKPLVAHIHSTEFDRSGEHVDQRIYDIERRGMHAAVRVIAVSMLTKSIVARRYGVDPDRVRVVYNGVQHHGLAPRPEARISEKDKIVLFLGRITMQKGPEYFVRSAKRVLEKMDNVKFIVAGNGDLARTMIEHAASLGIGHKVLFTGFLRGKDVERVFKMADCYVMPSVSEPFGIAPLEAMANDVPVIISKQSGVSEVLSHALKVDFWDVNEMANKILAVLRHPPLSATLRQNHPFELRKLTWEGAAEKVLSVYREAADELAGMSRGFAHLH